MNQGGRVSVLVPRVLPPGTSPAGLLCSTLIPCPLGARMDLSSRGGVTGWTFTCPTSGLLFSGSGESRAWHPFPELFSAQPALSLSGAFPSILTQGSASPQPCPGEQLEQGAGIPKAVLESCNSAGGSSGPTWGHSSLVSFSGKESQHNVLCSVLGKYFRAVSYLEQLSCWVPSPVWPSQLPFCSSTSFVTGKDWWAAEGCQKRGWCCSYSIVVVVVVI